MDRLLAQVDPLTAGVGVFAALLVAIGLVVFRTVKSLPPLEKASTAVAPITPSCPWTGTAKQPQQL